MTSAQSSTAANNNNIEYYPNRLSQSSVGSSARHAFLISGRDDNRGENPAVQAQILHVFFKHRVKIVAQSGYVDERKGEFVLSFCCDLRHADIDANGLVLALRLLKSVEHATSVSMKNHIFDGFLFPPTLMDQRVVLLNSKFAFLLEDSMKTKEEKAILHDIGRKYALEITRMIHERFSSGASEELIQENVTDYLKAAGLGRFNFFESEENSVRAVIRDPPTNDRGEATGNHFLQGMMVGLIEAFQRRTLVVAEDLYDPRTARLFLVLVQKDGSKKQQKEVEEKSDEKEPQQSAIAAEVQMKALQEVEKVIQSIEGGGGGGDKREEEVTSEHQQRIPILVENGRGRSSVRLQTMVSTMVEPKKIAEQQQQQQKASHEASEESASKSGGTVNLKEIIIAEKKVTTTPKRKPPTEEELQRAFRRVLSGSDDLFFEQSTYLE